MAPPTFATRELFHLAFLRQFGARFQERAYAVKGGICLRFFHRSPRLSEDLDIDVAKSMRLETLRDGVDAVLGGRALTASLLAAGVTGLEWTKPKQTPTTQRWKAALSLAGGGTLATKLEFSRRRERVAYSTGVPDAELLRRHRQPPFAARYYDAPSMAVQKIAALAAPARSALRDFFDLHHLLFTAGVQTGDLAAALEPDLAEAAAEKIGGFELRDFKEQVLPYLPDELMDLYRDPAEFVRQQERTLRALRSLLP